MLLYGPTFPLAMLIASLTCVLKASLSPSGAFPLASRILLLPVPSKRNQARPSFILFVLSSPICNYLGNVESLEPAALSFRIVSLPLRGGAQSTKDSRSVPVYHNQPPPMGNKGFFSLFSFIWGFLVRIPIHVPRVGQDCSHFDTPYECLCVDVGDHSLPSTITL